MGAKDDRDEDQGEGEESKPKPLKLDPVVHDAVLGSGGVRQQDED